jgi:hypothetical protein
MSANGRQGVVVASIAVLLFDLLALGVHHDRRRAPAPSSPAAQPARRAQTTPTADLAANPPGISASSGFDLHGTARSVAFQGEVRGFDHLALGGAGRLMAAGTVVDAHGRNWGRGNLTFEGPGVSFQGPGLAFNGFLRALPGRVALNGNGTLAATRLVANGATVNFYSQTTLTNSRLDGPVTVKDVSQGFLTADGSPVTGLPPVLTLDDGGRRSTLSWAGAGAIGAWSGQYLGVKASSISGTLRLADLELAAKGTAEQVYVDGVPKLKAAPVQVDVVAPPGSIAAGHRGALDWAPRDNSDIDMVILRVRPGSHAASWVNLALQPAPSMAGGEPGPRVGGDTDGLGKKGSGLFSSSAAELNVVILPHTADQKRLTIDVPAGTKRGHYDIVLVVEGNFDPVRLVVPLDVT